MSSGIVLVVEDDGTTAEIIREALRADGHRCVIAGDADAADRAVREHSVAAVTLDLDLPGRDGLTWLDEISETHPHLPGRTVIVTGARLAADALADLETRGIALLRKPLAPSEIVDRVREILDSNERPQRV